MAELALPFAKIHEMEALSARPPRGQAGSARGPPAYDTTPLGPTSPPLHPTSLSTGPPSRGLAAPAPHQGVETGHLTGDTLSGTAEIADGKFQRSSSPTATARSGVTLTSIAWAMDQRAQACPRTPSTACDKQQDSSSPASAFYQDGILWMCRAASQTRPAVRVDFRQRKASLASFARVVVAARQGAAGKKRTP